MTHDDRFCPTGYGCCCDCPDCGGEHCGPAGRAAYRFCIQQGIVPTGSATGAARTLLNDAASQERERRA